MPSPSVHAEFTIFEVSGIAAPWALGKLLTLVFNDHRSSNLTSNLFTHRVLDCVLH